MSVTGSLSIAWTLALVEWLRFLWARWQRASLGAVLPRTGADPVRPAPRVSLVVPARNEAATIEACLAGARAQDDPSLEIVVVDDRSEDDTAGIVRAAAAADPRVRLVAGQPLPDGWMGKCWALHQGSQAATGEWLLFVDADTRLQPGAVGGAVAAATARSVAMFSVLTAQEVPTWWERIVQPAVFAALAEALPAGLVNNPRLPQFALANGQFLMVRRDAYDAMGGHAAIRGEIVDDTQLAKRAKRLGWRYWLGDGRRLATTRMYTSPRAMWEGWTKNLHVGMRLLPWLVPPGTAYMVLSLAGPYLSLYGAARRRSPALALAGAAQLLAALARRRSVDALFGVPAAFTLAQPLGELAFLLLLSASFYKVLSGQGVTWKGRRYYAQRAAAGAASTDS